MYAAIISSFALLVGSAGLGADPGAEKGVVPKSARTRDDVLQAVEKVKGFGIVDWTESCRSGRRLLVVWYCPFSGRAAVYVHAYDFDGREWHLFWDTLLEGTHDLSVELPAGQDVLRCRGADGAIVHDEPIGKVPKVDDKGRPARKP